ncbi:MAG: oligosaccharide flippase family protein, partial [Flavobacteriaceae bacterium]
MSSKQNTYQQIIKATSLFGGVQVFNILLSVIKTKVVTIIIGPAGFGILGLFTATVKLILDFTKVGLDKSAVKELAEYDTLEDKTKRNEFIYVL